LDYSNGNLQWAKVFGGSNFEYGYSIYPYDNGTVVIGETSSFGNNGVIINVDANGNVQWIKTIGSSGNESNVVGGQIYKTRGIAASFTSSFGGGLLLSRWDNNGNIKTCSGGCQQTTIAPISTINPTISNILIN